MIRFFNCPHQISTPYCTRKTVVRWQVEVHPCVSLPTPNSSAGNGATSTLLSESLLSQLDTSFHKTLSSQRGYRKACTEAVLQSHKGLAVEPWLQKRPFKKEKRQHPISVRVVSTIIDSIQEPWRSLVPCAEECGPKRSQKEDVGKEQEESALLVILCSLGMMGWRQRKQTVIQHRKTQNAIGINEAAGLGPASKRPQNSLPNPIYPIPLPCLFLIQNRESCWGAECGANTLMQIQYSL